MITVEVVEIPVRYGGETYRKGEQFEMSDEHFEPVKDHLIVCEKEVKKRGGKAVSEKDGND